MYLRIVFFLISLSAATGCTSGMSRGTEAARQNPEICKEVISAGHPELKGPLEERQFKQYRYTECLRQAVKKNPHMCIELLASGPATVKGWSATKQEMTTNAEWVACKFYASKELEREETPYSRFTDKNTVYSGDESLSNAKFGRIASVQVENLSRPGTNAGSQLGAGVGQVAYLENTQTVRDYNPWAQMGAGLAGAALGSSLDSSATVSLKKTYWIKLNNGEFISISQYDRSSGHLPEGMCVAVLDDAKIQQARENLCK